ncbi:FAS1 domain-containing protein [Yarrowia sp. B02]|nr:FAS1 domain-containing protein [Yarrowia sp. B02]
MSLLHIFLLLTTLVATATAQIPPESRTIIDVLSETGQFSVLLRHLQHFELVPFLNTERNITLVAPDNGAFATFDGHVTRDLLLYHVLEGVSTYENGSDGSRVFLSALDHVPVTVDVNHKSRDMHVNGVKVVETDLAAGRQRGFVQVLESVLTLPSGWTSEISEISGVGHFAQLAKKSGLGGLSHVTVFAPTNDVMRVFSPLMDAYLLCHEGKEDLDRVVGHFVVDELVYEAGLGVSGLGLSGLGEPGLGLSGLGESETRDFVTRDGTTLSISPNLTINGTWAPVASNIPCQNGLIHVYDSLLESRDQELLRFSPRMALQGLGLDRFVALLRLAGLGELIEGLGVKQTIFAPVEKPSAMVRSRDPKHELDASLSSDEQQVLIEALEQEYFSESRDESHDLHSASSGLYSEGGAYHFTQTELILSRDLFKHKNHVLVDTKMKSKKIGYRTQRLKLSYDEVADAFVVNDRKIVSSAKYDKSLFVVGNSSIYLIDEEMEPPSGLASSVAPIFHTSRSLFYLNELGRLKLPLNYAGWTVILPTTTAWDSLGLVTEYLTSNKTALTLLFDSLIFHQPFYSDSRGSKLETFDKERNVTLEWIVGKESDFGDDFGDSEPISDDSENSREFDSRSGRFFKSSNSRGKSHEKELDFISVDGNLYKVNTLEYDILFNSGVVHTVENVFIPSDLDITCQNLIEVTNPDFVELLQVSNLSYTLDPELGYSFLVPSEASMAAENISIHSPDLASYMELHVIQNNTLGDGGSAATLKSGVSLVAKKFSELLMVSIYQGIDREARILNRGIASNNATVFSIDRPLSPAWIIPENPWFPSHDHLKTPVAIFIGIIIGLVAFFAILSCLLWVFLGKSKEPDEERAPVVAKPKPKSRTDILRQEAGVNTPLLAGGPGKTYTAPMSVNQPKKNGRGLKIGPQH